MKRLDQTKLLIEDYLRVFWLICGSVEFLHRVGYTFKIFSCNLGAALSLRYLIFVVVLSSFGNRDSVRAVQQILKYVHKRPAKQL